MLDVDDLVERCRVAVRESEPWLAVREVLGAALADRVAVAAALPPTRAVRASDPR